MKNLFVLPALITSCGLILAGPASAQTFATLYSFSATDPITGVNNDGAGPIELFLSKNILYGEARGGGNGGWGTVFALNTNGTSFNTLHSFTATSGFPDYINSDGASPNGGLILSDDTLYGTASSGGDFGYGNVFSLNTNEATFNTLYSFTAPVDNGSGTKTNSDGARSTTGLILSGDTLYGTTQQGGTGGVGTVFAIHADGTGFTTLHSFSRFTGESAAGIPINSDGAHPNGLILSGNSLYGTADEGGSSGLGTVFKLNTDGTGFRRLYSFTALDNNARNSDGALPEAGLILSEDTLYGTTTSGGRTNVGGITMGGRGTLFAVNTNGTGFRTLHSFIGSDGDWPGELILSSNTLYGTTYYGGTGNVGTVFAINIDGTGFKMLHSFTAPDNDGRNSDGMWPTAGLILSGDTLYGTATGGGSEGSGTVFSIALPVSPPLLAINAAVIGSVILTWPTNSTGFVLQSTTNLFSTATWTAVSPDPVVINGQNTVTNPISGTRKFYRLSQ